MSVCVNRDTLCPQYSSDCFGKLENDKNQHDWWKRSMPESNHFLTQKCWNQNSLAMSTDLMSVMQLNDSAKFEPHMSFIYSTPTTPVNHKIIQV